MITRNPHRNSLLQFADLPIRRDLQGPAPRPLSRRTQHCARLPIRNATMTKHHKVYPTAVLGKDRLPSDPTLCDPPTRRDALAYQIVIPSC